MPIVIITHNYSFIAFKDLMECKKRIAVELPDERKGLYCCAAADMDGGARIMIASYRQTPCHYAISIEGMDPQGLYLMEKRMVDDKHDYTLVSSAVDSLNKLCLDTWMDAYSVMTIRLVRVE